jgi:hypothetical protein
MIEGRLAPPQFIQSAKSRYPHRKIDILAFMRNGRARLPVGCETRNLALKRAGNGADQRDGLDSLASR